MLSGLLHTPSIANSAKRCSAVQKCEWRVDDDSGSRGEKSPCRCDAARARENQQGCSIIYEMRLSVYQTDARSVGHD